MGLLAVASVALMTLDHRQHHADALRATIALFLYPIQSLVSLPYSTGTWLSENLSSRQTLLKENNQLHNDQLLLKVKLQKLESLAAENLRLRELLGSTFKIGERTLIAELLTVDMDPFSQRLLINKGSINEVYTGQPILDAEGVMGQIIDVSLFSSTALLITDPSHAIPVEVNRNGLRAIALGVGDPTALELPHIPNNSDIKPGDLLVTSGLGGRFPPGYPVARVTTVTNVLGASFANVSAAPTAKLLSTREILLVWLQQPIYSEPAPVSDSPDAHPSAEKRKPPP